jgi:uncharacterized protein with PIN domain
LVTSRKGNAARLFKYLNCFTCKKVIGDTSDPEFDELEAPQYCFACVQKLGYFNANQIADMPKDGDAMTEVIHRCVGCNLYVMDWLVQKLEIGMVCPNCSSQLVSVVKDAVDENVAKNIE